MSNLQPGIEFLGNGRVSPHYAQCGFIEQFCCAFGHDHIPSQVPRSVQGKHDMWIVAHVSQLLCVRLATDQEGLAIPEKPDGYHMWTPIGSYRDEPDNLVGT